MQEDLSGVIKSLHSSLRRQCMMGKDPEEVWRIHTSDRDTLNSYAKAMKQLATEHWEKDKNRETRIIWCEKYIISYYASGGALQRLIDKDKRSLDFHTQSPADPSERPLRCCGDVYTEECYVKHRSEVAVTLNTRLKLSQISIPLTNYIRILDVGSCYAPFSRFSQFDCLSLDLCPASPEVFQCDFLNVSTHSIMDNSLSPIEASQMLSTTNTDPILSLPLGWFHGVVFSLLLEYLPTPQQRWRCCIKAHMLLQINAVLVIITPDSSKQHRRTQQMKDWKLAVEHIGFLRCRYEKLDHIHCMAFRKIAHRSDYSTLSDMAGKMYIPQDFNTELARSDANTELDRSDTNTELARSDANTELARSDANTELAISDTNTELARSDTNTELARSDASTELARSDANTELAISDANTELAISDANTALARSDANTELTRSDANTEFAISDANTELAISDANTELDRSDANTELNRSDANTELAKSDTNTELAISDANTSRADADSQPAEVIKPANSNCKMEKTTTINATNPLETELVKPTLVKTKPVKTTPMETAIRYTFQSVESKTHEIIEFVESKGLGFPSENPETAEFGKKLKTLKTVKYEPSTTEPVQSDITDCNSMMPVTKRQRLDD